MKKHYDKLVRDKIPEIIEEAGKTAHVYQVSSDRLKKYALMKLREEVEEFIESPSAKEAADILEVLYFICKHEQIQPLTIDAERIAKRISKGAFNMGFVLEWVEEK